MNGFEFYTIVLENYWVYIFVLLGVSLPYIYIGQRYTHTWADPLRFNLLTNVFVTAVPVFLFIKGFISIETGIYFLIAQSVFWVAFIIPATKYINFSKKVLINETEIAYWLYIIFLFLYVLSISITYIVLGIPLFRESRLDTYTNTGLGILGRMLPFLQIYCIFYSFYLWRSVKKLSLNKLIVIFSFILFFVTGILSGSRSSIFIFIFTYWAFCYFYLRNTGIIAKYYKFLFIGIGISIMTFTLKADSKDMYTGLISFLSRVISSGDTYYMAFPNDVWKQIQTGPWFNHLFYGFFGPLRLISGEGMPPAVGFQLTWIVNPSLYGQSTGPLSSPQLLGLLYFGWGGIFFSFIMGLFVSIMIYRIPSLLPKGLISSIVATYLYFQASALILDSCLGMASLFDTILNLIILFLTIFLINKFIDFIKAERFQL